MRRTIVVAAALSAALLLSACSSDHDSADGGHADQMGDQMGDQMNDQAGGMGGMGDMGDGHVDDSPVTDGAREIEVEAGSLAFTPNELTAKVGEPVAIRLSSEDLPHDLVVDEVGLHVHADAGETAVGGFTATEEGTYTIYCSVPGHRSGGMEGTLTITPA